MCIGAVLFVHAAKHLCLEIAWGVLRAATPALHSRFFVSAVSVPAKKREVDAAGTLPFLEPEQA